MFKKRTIIIGLILLLAIGVLASLGWAVHEINREMINQTPIVEIKKGVNAEINKKKRGNKNCKQLYEQLSERRRP